MDLKRRIKVFFSIIIPIYNSQDWLERCFNSLRSQPFSDYEVILINDASTDNSEDICKKYADSDARVRYYRQEAQGGVSAARNRGLDEARGSFICFLDSDDAYEREFLLKLNQAILSHPNSGHFFCGYKLIRPTQVIENKLPDQDEIVCLDRKQAMTLYNAILLQSASNKAYRRDIIEAQHLRFREGVSLGEDLLFNLEYLDRCPNTQIIVENRPLYNYCRDNPNSLVNQYNPQYRDIFNEIADKMGMYFRKWELDAEQMTLYYNAVYNMMINSMKHTFRLANKKSYKEKIAYNNEILKSERFKEAVNHSEGVVNPLYKIVYGLNNYRLVRGLDKVREVYIKKIKNK